MSDEQIIKLLEEIRDLQRDHAENYKQAVRNQEARWKLWDENRNADAQSEQLRRQKQLDAWAATRRRQKWLIITAVIALVLVYLLPSIEGLLKIWLRK